MEKVGRIFRQTVEEWAERNCQGDVWYVCPQTPKFLRHCHITQQYETDKVEANQSKQVWQYYKWIFPRITPALPRMKSSRHILTRNRSCCTQLVQGDDNTTRYGDRLHATQRDFCCSLHRSNSVNNKGRPNFVFGFGFGAECVHCSTFGILSVSAESNSCHFRWNFGYGGCDAESGRTPKVANPIHHYNTKCYLVS